MGLYLVKFYTDIDKEKVDKVHNSLSAHFDLPKGRVKTYSKVIECNDGYGFFIALDGNYDASSLIDTSKVIDYTAPEVLDQEEERTEEEF